jgi:hypothetical protein
MNQGMFDSHDAQMRESVAHMWEILKLVKANKPWTPNI